jgi:hypothetical protein
VVVVEAAAEEPEFQLDSGLDSWEDFDVWKTNKNIKKRTKI